MVTWRRLEAWLVAAIAALPLSCVPFDVDNIACSGHGQCPTGYHCDLDSGLPVGVNSVCVPGEAQAAGLGASVQRVSLPYIGMTLGYTSALHTARAELPGIQEAINEDVLGIPLMLGAAGPADSNSSQPRYRAHGDNLYHPLESQYVLEGIRPEVHFTSPSLAQRGWLDVTEGTGELDRLNTGPLHCGQSTELRLDDSPQTFAEGAGWEVGSMFASGGTATGPAMPAMPVPQGGALTGGRVLLAPESPFHLQVADAGVDPSAQETFLFLGEAFTLGNSPDCGEVECDDGEDNDGDGMTDCLDLDCQGELGRYPGSDEQILCPELICWDGIDNDSDGDVDCDDLEDCEHQDCTLRSADVVSFPVSEEGLVEVSWEQLPQFVRSGSPNLLLAWGRTRSQVALDVVDGVESAMLSSSQWAVYEAVVLDSSQYVVSVDAQNDKVAGGRALHLELTPLDGLRSWSGDYLVAALDRFGHQLLALPISNPHGPWVRASATNSLSVQLDTSSLCRGATTLAVTSASFPQSEEDLCIDCGIGTLDDPRPYPQCDVVLAPGEREADVVPGAVICASLDESKVGESEVHRYSFEAVAGTTYLIEGLGNQLFLESGADLQLGLHYDDNGSLRLLSEGEWGLVLAEQDYCGMDPRLLWHCPETGRYELKVESPEGLSDGGPYKLLIEAL